MDSLELEGKPIKNEEKRAKVHPKEHASCLSSLFYCWTFGLMKTGYQKHLTEEDLCLPLSSDRSELLGDELENSWNVEVETKRNPSFARALIRVFWWHFLRFSILFLISEFAVKIHQPLLIGKFLEYYEPNQTHMSKKEAYIYAALIIGSTFFVALLGHQYLVGIQHLGLRIRLAICSLIYRKSLRLSKSAMVKTTTGQIVNMVTNDVSRFEFVVLFLNGLWASPVETVIVAYFLYDRLGWQSLCGVVLLFAVVPLQLYLSRVTAGFRRKTALKTDQRVKLMNEIICGIQVIKMYAWEKPFAKLVNLSRKFEIDKIRGVAYIKGFQMCFSLSLQFVAFALSFVAYVLTENTLDAKYVYVVIQYYSILMSTVVHFLPFTFNTMAETKVSIDRIQNYLLSDEVSPKQAKNDNSLFIKSDKIVINNATAKWDHSLDENTLNNINFKAGSNQVVAIVGPVASGKSTLLQVILKELDLEKGEMEVNGRISYVAQEAWIFDGSIRQNILFGMEFDESRYKEVIKVCALERDLTLFEYGDKTIVGERGVMLSGGQKARINLARAVYKDADIYLLDDPLSAVDAKVGNQLFNKCICGFLKNKCTVLVTHQLQYLQNVDKIYMLDNGSVRSSGDFVTLKNSGNKYLRMLSNKEEEEDEAAAEKVDEPKMKGQQSKVREIAAEGNVSGQVYMSYLRASGHLCCCVLIAGLFILCQVAFSGSSYFLSFWLQMEEQRMENNATNNYSQVFYEEFFTTYNCMYVYCSIVGFICLITLVRSLCHYNKCMKASQNLHNTMFSKIVHNTMRFFNTNPSGRILNRFSKDIGSIDEVLPSVLQETVQIFLNVLGIMVVIALVNPYIMIPNVILMVLLYFYKNIFMATSRALKRLDGITRSPIYTHMSATLQGLTTIRAFGAQQMLKQQFDNYQNLHSPSAQLFIGVNRSFGFWMDMHNVVYTTIVTLSFLLIGSDNYAGNVGLAITQSIALTTLLQWGVRQWGELENQMTSVERVAEYTRLETENTSKIVPSNWPRAGKIEFKSVSLQYAADLPKVLKNLTLTINAKEKIGIVGRTGAGKSSLISALFRLVEPQGVIEIDGVDTKSISLHSLRSKISIIPQEPVLFSGTIRMNLDPFDEFDDETLWKALAEVELSQAISELPLGLQCNVTEGGSNFSVGQRQLLCLARAIVRSNKMLVMDEATANVDLQTDELIQTTIRRKFADCTVLTIAHRLHTVRDSDKILLMDNGEAVEFDHPCNLLENVDGVFYGLVQQVGKVEEFKSFAKKLE